MERRSPIRAVSIALILTLGGAAWAARAPVHTDPEKAGPDYRVQGEYVGQIQTDRGKAARGVQVVALGSGKFRSIGYQGGLPGDGWDRSKPTVGEGVTADGVTTLPHEDGSRHVVRDGALTVYDAGGSAIATLKKKQRRSPTLGAKPPKGAVVLFDGTSPKHFRPSIRRTPKHELMTEDGLLREGVDSKRTFQSFSIHLEFRTPFMPDRKPGSQGRGNSGFYSQGRYEVQILDSFGVVNPRSGHCGGIYGVRPPTVNMCLPPLTGQTYDVDLPPRSSTPTVRRPRTRE